MSTGLVDLDRAIREHLLDPAQAMVEQVAQALRAKNPGLPVETIMVFGFPRDLFVEASRSAELEVVGSRGYGGFRGFLKGSVSQAVLHEGRSPRRADTLRTPSPKTQDPCHKPPSVVHGVKKTD
jgi:nucleotide-binding universal stress UspA family protein